MGSIAENLGAVRNRIAEAARKSGRAVTDVKLVAVSKTHPRESVMEAYEAGQRIFGENYAREMIEKYADLPEDIRWHFIGSLQRNKVKAIVDKVAMIQSVDKLSLAEEIDRRSAAPVDALIEVNIAGEESKSGANADEVAKLVEAVRDLKKIRLRGLMTMPPFFDKPEMARPYFIKLRELRDKLRKITGLDLNELSMGMSGDFEVAIEEGATIARVGTAVFGERQ